MQVYYELLGGEKLCFVHAVKAVVDNGEYVEAHVPDAFNDIDDLGGTRYLGEICCRCYPEEEDD